jgi:hypothetical protein
MNAYNVAVLDFGHICSLDRNWRKIAVAGIWKPGAGAKTPISDGVDRRN